jgi:hypothetical protein
MVNNRSVTAPSLPSAKAFVRLYSTYSIWCGSQGMLHVCMHKQQHVHAPCHRA